MTSGGAERQDTLVWADEFNGDEIDGEVWEHQLGDGSAYGLPAGWGNGELQIYTDRAESSFVADGMLHIVVRREEGDPPGFTSARLRTMGRVELLYGRIAARIRLPSGQGMWPAFWMLPNDWVYGGWAASGEIDIVESINVADTAYGTIHYGGEWPDNLQSGGSVSLEDDGAPEFHIFEVEWSPDEIVWSVDGTEYHRETSDGWSSSGAPDNPRAPFDQPFHLLLNVAVGGRWPGPPDETTAFPQAMVVDWVRVFRRREARPVDGVVESASRHHGDASVWSSERDEAFCTNAGLQEENR